MGRNALDRRPARALLSVTEAAERLGMSKAAAYRAIHEGTFPVEVVTVGGRRRVRASDVDAFLAGNRRPQAHEVCPTCGTPLDPISLVGRGTAGTGSVGGGIVSISSSLRLLRRGA